jgi:hypothetical protein
LVSDIVDISKGSKKMGEKVAVYVGHWEITLGIPVSGFHDLIGQIQRRPGLGRLLMVVMS